MWETQQEDGLKDGSKWKAANSGAKKRTKKWEKVVESRASGQSPLWSHQ